MLTLPLPAAAEGLPVTRRHFMSGLAATAGGTMAAASDVAHADVPAVSRVAELIADWKWSAAAYEEVADRLERFEQQHPEIVEAWPSVDVGLHAVRGHGGPIGDRLGFPSAIDDAFARQAAQLRVAFGDDCNVDQVIRALEPLRLRAHASLEQQWAEWQQRREACGMAAIEREAKIAADREIEAFHTILEYQPTTADEAADRNGFLLEFVARWPADPKVSDIREMLFSADTAMHSELQYRQNKGT